MTEDASNGWLRSLFKRPAAEPPSPSARQAEVAPPPDDAAPKAGEGPPPLAASTAVSYYRLQSTQGRFLGVEAGAAELAAQESLDPAHAVVVIVPEAAPHLCLLALQDGRPFHIAGDTLTGIGVSARILRSTMRGVVRLKQPLNGARYLTLDDDQPAPYFDGQGNSLAAAFHLLPIGAEAVTVVLRSLANEFGAAIGAGIRQAEFFTTLREGRVRPELAEALLRLLPPDELNDLSRRLLDEPQALAVLKQLLPKDPSIQTHLPALVAWRATRGPVSPNGQLISPAADEMLILPSANESGVPPGHALHALARGHVSPRRDFCIMALARNEGPFMLEWLAYHLSIGFEHFFIYTNDNTDGSEELLALLARHGVITLVHNARGQRIGVQEKATAHALTLVPQILDYRWTAVMDLDEYLCFDGAIYNSIGDFIGLHEAQPVDAIALCWLIFASKFGEPYKRGLTTERFPWRADDVNSHVKCMFRTRRFWGSQPHHPYPTMEAPFNFRTEEGDWHHHPGVKDRIAAFSERPTASHGWINHYIFRSAPEALWKLARGSVAWLPSTEAAERPVMENFITKAFTDFASSPRLIQDTRISLCGHGQAAMLEKLRALPGVAELDETIRFNFELNLKKLGDTFLAAPLPAHPPDALLRFREALMMSQGLPKIPIVQPVLSAIV